MRRALAANPSYVDVYFTLVPHADHLKDQKKAVEAFERYLELTALIIGHVKSSRSRGRQTRSLPPQPPNLVRLP